ncbi:glycosyltransferase [Luteimonas kalidii]|uniref:Glycosyltransferase n=1 Tax=Luteimonas kalidii TaxID=3042025 RepID=A0ABT6JRA9_9GAMM|nr:glycosyltransferase [Luteimonas kalidii]MDH5833038.1 glycosyltransferase [Luteimonas kalidii]
MTRPVISVCVATYNQVGLIERCLRSILEQEVVADVQVMVGDDASTDGTSEVLEKLAAENGSRLLHLRRARNMGAIANISDLLGRAQGDFIARVDGDDFWLPGKLSRQLEFFANHPECDAVYTNAITVDASGMRCGVFNDVGDEQIDLARLLRRGNFLNNSSVLFRAMDRPGWASSIEQIDYQVHLWQAQRGRLGHIGEPLTAYRLNSQGSMILSANAHVRELYWRAIQSVPRDLVTDDDYAHGITDFLRRVFFRSVRTRDPELLRTWGARVYAASPYRTGRTTALVVANIMRMMGKMLVGQLRGRDHRNVLYRR